MVAKDVETMTAAEAMAEVRAMREENARLRAFVSHLLTGLDKVGVPELSTELAKWRKHFEGT